MKWFSFSDVDQIVYAFKAVSPLEAQWIAFFRKLGCTVERVHHPEMLEIGPCLEIVELKAIMYVCDQINDELAAKARTLAEVMAPRTILLTEANPAIDSKPRVRIFASDVEDENGKFVAIGESFYVGCIVERCDEPLSKLIFWRDDNTAFGIMSEWDIFARKQFQICLCKEASCETCSRFSFYVFDYEWINASFVKQCRTISHETCA